MTNLAATRKKSLKQSTPCIGIKKNGEPCKKWSLKTSDFCLKHQGSRAVVLHDAPLPPPATRFGIYAKNLSDAQQEIRINIAKQGLLDDFKKPDLEDELMISRVILADLLDGQGDAQVSNTARIRTIETVARIAKIAKHITEIDQEQVKADFLNAVINAMNYAFHRANGLQDPAERAKVFVDEFASFFPQSNQIQPAHTSTN